MTRQEASRPFLLFRFALREGDFVLAQLIARALWRGRQRPVGPIGAADRRARIDDDG